VATDFNRRLIRSQAVAIMKSDTSAVFQPWIGPEGVLCKAIKAAFMASPVMGLT
jgi:hypothetical protein